MNIDKQKKIALEILHKLEAVDPTCILAGGAPRNWYFNKEANDLDFYIHLPNETLENTGLRFKRLGLNLTHVDYKSDAWKEYGVMVDLFRIYDGNYSGQKVQVMIMNKNTFESVLPEFGVSICKFWWKGGKINPTLDALISVLEKTLYVKEGYSAKEIHVEKVKNYFPEYNVLGYDSFPTVAKYYSEKYFNSDILSQSYREYLEKLINDQQNNS